MTVTLTGGSGFIGSNFVFDSLAQSDEPIVNFDKLTFAGDLKNLASLHCNPSHLFVECNLDARDLVVRMMVE